MLLAHFGVAVFVIGVTVVNGYQVEKDLRMSAGESTEIAGMRVRFDGVREVRGPNYIAARGTLRADARRPARWPRCTPRGASTSSAACR